MNSTDFEILAGVAIAEWGRTHNGGCILSLDGSAVVCSKNPEGPDVYNNPLFIWGYEVKDGLRKYRWSAIGTCLINLYNKGNECQKHQKH